MNVNLDNINMAVVIPIIIIQLILMAIALIDLARREPGLTRGPKLMWVFIIIVGNLVGSIAYFVIGRRQEA